MIFNIFRILGDLSHLLSFVFLLIKLKKSRSAYGMCLSALRFTPFLCYSS